MYCFYFSEPPSPPQISGLPSNETLREGQDIELLCASYDGSPVPQLQWYEGDSKSSLIPRSKTQNGAATGSQQELQQRGGFQLAAMSKISLKVTREDNGKIYRFVQWMIYRIELILLRDIQKEMHAILCSFLLLNS